MNDTSDESPLSRRDLLKYAGTATAVGFAGFTGLTLGSEPAIADPTGTPSIASTAVEGSQPISEFPISHSGLSTSSPITVSYTLTVDGVEQSSPAVQNTHELSSQTGEITAGGGTIKIPPGSVSLTIDVTHPDLSKSASASQGTATSVPQIANGGSTVVEPTINGTNYRIHAFETVGSNTLSMNGSTDVDVLLVGGGGGGGGGFDSGGGGGGGVVVDTVTAVSTGDKTVTVGAGGTIAPSEFNPGYRGDQTTAFNLTARGGGGGTTYNGSARTQRTDNNEGQISGGSGGGGVRNGAGVGSGRQPNTNTDATIDAGNGGGSGDLNSGGGGGGAGQVGDSAGNNGGIGGDGRDVSGTFGTQFGEADSNGDGAYFGGGGGGQGASGTHGSGGLGGGGAGNNGSTTGTGGAANTGGGCGGASFGTNDHPGDTSGGSGIVLVRYQI